MKGKLLSRVIMKPDGTAHIAFEDRQTIACTPKNLSEFLSDPYGFLDDTQYDYEENTKKTNPQKLPLEDIKGLTLLKIYEDTEIVCIFPKLFQALFSDIEKDPDKPINLKEYILSLDVSDEKHFLLRFFCEITGQDIRALDLKRTLGLDPETKGEILRETYDSFFSTLLNVKKQRIRDSEIDEDTTDTSAVEDVFEVVHLDKEYVSSADFAKICGVEPSTVSTWLSQKKLRGAKKVKGRWQIPSNTPRPPDGRKGCQKPPRSQSGIKKYMKGNIATYEEIQEYIKNEEKLSPEVAQYIRSYDEVCYYTRHCYHEVHWDGRYCLIIDIKPDYILKSTGETNRQRILSDDAPLIPGKEDYKYILHHVGQEFTSPFAILREDVHQKDNGIFHVMGPNSVPTEKLHDDTYNNQRVSFWKRYLEMYDKYNGIKNIPGTSLNWERQKILSKKREKNKQM